MNTRNSKQTIWINTATHRCTAMEEDVSYHPEDLRQGRDCQTPVGRFSMLAGKPIEGDENSDGHVRAMFWQSYVASIILCALCVFLLAVWPN